MRLLKSNTVYGGGSREEVEWMDESTKHDHDHCMLCPTKDNEGSITLKKGHFDQNITIFSPKLNQTSTRVLLHKTDFLFF